MNHDPAKSEGLPRYPESMWRKTTSLPTFSKLTEDIDTEVAIIGAGIVGITTAYLLVQAGLKVTVIDAGKVLDGTTGHTTAKITAQHGMIYDQLISHFGRDSARLYYEANEEALQFIAKTVKERRIECQFRHEDAYLYADSDQQLKQLEAEWKAYEELGLPGDWLNELSLPLEARGAIVLHNQAQFHPLHYLQELVSYITKHGGTFYEHTTLKGSVENLDGGRLRLATDDGPSIVCSHAVSASHFPFTDGKGFYFTRLYAERSYVVAIEPEQAYPGGMYINCGNPKRSLRSAEWNGKTVVLAGGESHKTGKDDCTFKHYEELEKFGRAIFGAKSIPFRWSTQDLETLDKVPYIGHLTSNHPNIYVATGFGKWGMTNSTVSALLIRDLILKKENRYTELFTPSRFIGEPTVKNFFAQNADVAKELVTGKIEIVHLKPEDLVPDQGAVVKHQGKRAGAYRDPKGLLYLVDTTCTHLGCEVKWNEAERSWDCPCHGSRFNYKGEVIEGPATEDLPRLSRQPEQEKS
ncbi:FAD-dependent oxidoreductase [Paenibacillus puldeungensis]|uniref:FAD-dependent oxidoreductase n=1 Tax=Paenibacillus puldeungensis TaxID=696536 RepID=A0ABW3S3I0_9BACL